MRITLAALLIFFTTAATAATRYVDDHLIITMRTGKANTFQILRTIPSGTVVELLEEDGDYSRIRTDDGQEGWVLSRFLTTRPIAKVRLARTEKQLEKVREEKRRLEERLAALNEEKSSLDKEHSSLGSETEQLRKQLDDLREVAARPIELAQQNETLNNEVGQLQRQLQQVKAENDRLHDRSQRDWFLAGAGVLIGGILLGLILPRLRRKKRGMFE